MQDQYGFIILFSGCFFPKQRTSVDQRAGSDSVPEATGVKGLAHGQDGDAITLPAIGF